MESRLLGTTASKKARDNGAVRVAARPAGRGARGPGPAPQTSAYQQKRANDSSRTVGHGHGHVYGHARAIPIQGHALVVVIFGAAVSERDAQRAVAVTRADAVHGAVQTLWLEQRKLLGARLKIRQLDAQQANGRPPQACAPKQLQNDWIKL